MQKKKSILPFIVFIELVVIVALVFGISYRYKPTNERYDLNTFFGNPGAKHYALMVNDVLLEEQANIENDEIYLAYSTVEEYISDRFFWDEELKCIIYVMPDGPHILKAEDGFYISEDTVYVKWDLITKYAQINYVLAERPNRIIIQTEDDTKSFADVKKDGQIRYRAGVKSPILKDVTKGESVRILDTVDDWTHVITSDGFIGYIKSNCLGKEYENVYDIVNAEQVYPSVMLDEKVCLAWHQMTSTVGNDTLDEKLSGVKGLNVISPTWFFLSDSQGNVKSIADAEYVQTCHNLGIQVWALIENITYDVDEYNVFANYSIRQRVIDSLISECLRYDIDGINVDFEQLAVEEGAGYIQFIRELSIECHKNGLVLSSDNYVPYNFNSFYNRDEQAVFCDYVIVMSYDEHLNDETGAGSVASLDYVRYGIEESLKEIPKEKLINAIPFYTRLWVETPKTEQEIASENAAEEYSAFNLSWQTLGIADAINYVDENGMESIWYEETGQYYCETEKEGSVYKIWLEDERSLEEKLKIVQEKDIAGIGAWKLGLETDAVWDLIEKYYPE